VRLFASFEILQPLSLEVLVLRSKESRVDSLTLTVTFLRLNSKVPRERNCCQILLPILACRTFCLTLVSEFVLNVVLQRINGLRPSQPFSNSDSTAKNK
jgi:hypothetical protein